VFPSPFFHFLLENIEYCTELGVLASASAVPGLAGLLRESTLRARATTIQFFGGNKITHIRKEEDMG
jgi:hypothetical protein